MKQLIRVIALFFIVIGVSFIFLIYNVETIPSLLKEDIKGLYIQRAKNQAKKFNETLHHHIKTPNLLSILKKNRELYHFLNDMLFFIADKNYYPYVYLLYKDKKGRYRYLLDGSIQERGELGEKLDVNKKIWDGVWNSKVPLLFRQEGNLLYLTYLYPIIYNKQTRAILAIDITPKVATHIAKMIAPIQQTLRFIVILFIVMIVIIIYEAYIFYKSKKASLIDTLTGLYNRLFF